MIAIEHLRHGILRIESCTLPGGHGAVIGKNGSGKTTLLELCAGMELPDAGEVRIGERPPRLCEVGYVGEFPDRNMVFERVCDEIASPLRFRGLAPDVIETAVPAAAERAGIRRLLDTPARSLSGGEKALVALATALAVSPEILVLDEVDSHLDAAAAERLLRLIDEAGVPVVLQSTQNMDTAAEADWVLLLDGGRVCALGTPEEVFGRLEETCFYPPLWRMQRCR